MWLDKLKLNKQLVRSVTEAGFLTPKEIQAKTLSRIIGGQDIIGIGPEGCGKTTAYILGVLTRLKYGVEEAPRALILVPDKEHVLEVIGQFELLNKNKTIRVVGLYPGPSIETQMDELFEGVDIVVATPDRARAVYLKLGLNLNKIMILVVDDAELIIKNGLQLPVTELATSIRNCQHLVFTEVLHEKLEQMVNSFNKQAARIEIEEMSETTSETVPQVLYHVPNFRTKINLLQLLTEDTELFTKAIVFVNTRFTAEKLFQSLKPGIKRDSAILNPIYFDSTGAESIEDFKENEQLRILIAANELQSNLDIQNIPFIIHFELPEEKETYISRIVKTQTESEQETLAITFSTDIELSTVKKIEQATGKKVEFSPLPEDLIIVKEQEASKEKVKTQTQEAPEGAFHSKKASNAKDYNYSAGLKAKMNNKRKH